MQSSYITSAQQAEQLPDLMAPEVAFVGRSNCGKSSLLNALLGRNGLARTSNTPGRTQMVNFFAVDKGEDRLIFADLPGYGYSAIGKDARQHWDKLVATYLLRPVIRDILFLLDVRRAEELGDDDLELLRSLTGRRPLAPVTIVLTKVDKVSRADGQKIIAKLAKDLKKEGLVVARVAPVSTLKGTGVEELRQAVLGAFIAGS